MQKMNFSLNWSFSLRDGAVSYPARRVNLPHDWSVELPRSRRSRMEDKGGFFQGGEGEYKKMLRVPADWKGMRVVLEVEGAYMNAEVWLRGHLLERHPYGYTSFLVDLTQHITPGEDCEVTIKVANNALPNSRWYSGSGLYRPVNLWVGAASHIKPWGVFVRTLLHGEGAAQVDVSTELTATANLRLESAVVDARGRVVAQHTQDIATGDAQADQMLMVKSPQLWDVAAPTLYTLKSTLFFGNDILDRVETPFGIREIKLEHDRGFVLNGQPIKLRGGCVHHDCGILGAAAHADAEWRKAGLLKASGFNFVRCAHNPPSPAFLDACDALGLLVMDEAFDCWEEGKTPYDYHLYFDAWWKRDIEAMVRRDRNHPSIAFWSTGNEIPERFGAGRGYDLARELVNAVKELDDTRFVTNALCGIWGEKDVDWPLATEPFAERLDVVGYNYLWERYEEDVEEFPERYILGCESVPADAWENWQRVLAHPRILGDCVWTAMDYLGEAGIGRSVLPGEDDRHHDLPYPWMSANCGDIDLCGRQRAQSQFRRVMWKHRQKPYIAVHQPNEQGRRTGHNYWGWEDVRNSWSYPGLEGYTAHIDVYSAADEVELIVNGEMLGRKPAGAEHGFIASFEAPYRPGVVKAIAYTAGRVSGEDVVETTGDPHAIVLEAETEGIPAEYGRLAYVWAKVVDARGNVVPFADDELFFTCVGAGRLLAAGNADPMSEEGFRGAAHSVYEGYALCAVMADGTRGKVHLSAMGEGLTPATVAIKVG